MEIREKIELFKTPLPENTDTLDFFYNIFEKADAIRYNYADYMVTSPINCDKDLERLFDADYDLCCALMTLLFREDHFSGYGCFDRRYKNGDVQKIIDRIILLLENKFEENKRRLSARAAEYLMFLDD